MTTELSTTVLRDYAIPMTYFQVVTKSVIGKNERYFIYREPRNVVANFSIGPAR
jgi:hypothetical protein